MVDININLILGIFIAGAVFLAAIYHSVLYIHNRTKLLAYYTAYLWCICGYCFFRIIFPGPELPGEVVNADETLQMIAFAMYIQFMGTALNLDKIKERYAIFFVNISVYVIAVYIILQIININTFSSAPVYIAAKILIRAYLLILGLFMLIGVMLKRKLLYYKYLATGAISIIFFGLLSSIVSLSPVHTYSIAALTWLFIGFFADVVFFSSAIGYRMKIEALEKERALSMVLQQQDDLQQKEIEQIQVIYNTREQERMRIAKDLHDDVGASLSSVHLYSELATRFAINDPGKAKDILEKITDNTQKAMEEMGDIIWSINPSEDEDKTIAARIKNYGSQLLSIRNINCQYRIEDTLNRKLKNIDARKNLLLIIKEALNNIAKYSNATEAAVEMTEQEGWLFVLITDNGSGFNDSEIQKGNGLNNIQNRTQSLGGNCSIHSVPGQGTRIKCMIPVTRFSDTGYILNR